MKLDNLIKEIYGSVDKMIETTGTLISRSYIYQIISGEKTNISTLIAKELVTLLKLNSIDEYKIEWKEQLNSIEELMEIIDEPKRESEEVQ